MSKKRSTRSTGVTNLSQYLGAPAELIPSEVPTVRDVLRYLIYLQSYDNRNSGASISELAGRAAEQVQNAWEISNSAFSTPVVIAKTSIEARIVTAYEFFNTYINRKLKKLANVTKKSVANLRINDLDRLFDITKCRCEITSCIFDSDVCKPACQVRI